MYYYNDITALRWVSSPDHEENLRGRRLTLIIVIVAISITSIISIIIIIMIVACIGSSRGSSCCISVSMSIIMCYVYVYIVYCVWNCLLRLIDYIIVDCLIVIIDNVELMISRPRGEPPRHPAYTRRPPDGVGD